MATKLDTEKPIFLGPTAVREGTVVDNIRQAVSQLDQGEGVKYDDLEKHLLENFAPSKSQSYGPSYVKSYVRDGIHRYDHLSHENGGHEYSAIEPAPKKATKAKGLTRKEKTEVEYMDFIRQHGEVSSADELDQTQISIQDYVTETNRKTKTIEGNVAKLEEKGWLRTEEREGNEEGSTVTYVFLTPEGYTRLEEVDAQLAELASAESEETSED